MLAGSLRSDISKTVNLSLVIPGSVSFFFVIFAAFCEKKQKSTKQTKGGIIEIQAGH